MAARWLGGASSRLQALTATCDAEQLVGKLANAAATAGGGGSGGGSWAVAAAAWLSRRQAAASSPGKSGIR